MCDEMCSIEITDVEKSRQLRSRIVQTLNVPQEGTPRPFTRCGLAEQAF